MQPTWSDLWIHWKLWPTIGAIHGHVNGIFHNLNSFLALSSSNMIVQHFRQNKTFHLQLYMLLHQHRAYIRAAKRCKELHGVDLYNKYAYRCIDTLYFFPSIFNMFYCNKIDTDTSFSSPDSWTWNMELGTEKGKYKRWKCKGSVVER